MTACGEEEGTPELEFPGVCTSPAPALYKGGSSRGAATRPPASQEFRRDSPQHPSPCSCALLMGWLAALALLWTLVLCRGLRRPVPHPHVQCYSAGDLHDGEAPAPLLSRSLRWDHYVPVQLVPQLERLQDSPGHRRHRRHREHSCPALQLRTGLHSEPHERSISPWRYHINEDEDRYPRKLAFAECLCRGCVDVKTGRETTSLNSVAIYQTMMVLRRKPCPRPASPGLVTFEVEYIRVPVGCTCVLPRTGR